MMNGASISVELEVVHETIVQLLLAVKDLTVRIEALEHKEVCNSLMKGVIPSE